MNRLLSRFAIIALLGSVLMLAEMPAWASHTPIPTGTACIDVEEASYLTLLNDYRAANGSGPLVLNRTLSNAADWHAHDGNDAQVLSHTLAGPDHLLGTADDYSWSVNIDNWGYPPTWQNGENGSLFGDPSGAATLEGFKGSPAHNDNQLYAGWRAVGIGRVQDRSEPSRYFWFIDFGANDDGTRPVNCDGSPPPTTVPLPTPTPGPTQPPAPTATPKPCHGNSPRCR